MLFTKFVPEFLSICVDRKNSAGEMLQKRLCLGNHLKPYFGDMDMNKIGKPEIRRYVKEKLADGYAEKTINNHLLILSRFLTVAHDERAISTPKVKIESIPVEFSEARYLTGAECRALVEAAGEESPAMRALIVVALNTGMRIGELLALDWSAVDMRAANLSVTRSLCRASGKFKAPKNKRRRDIALNADAKAALMSMAKPADRQGLVFHIQYGTAYEQLQRICEAAELADVGFHTLRHTFASLMILAGETLFVVSRLLGHSSVKMTERYAHLHKTKTKTPWPVWLWRLGADMKNFPMDGIEILNIDNGDHDLTITLKKDFRKRAYVDIAGESACSHNYFDADEEGTKALRDFIAAAQKALAWLEGGEL